MKIASKPPTLPQRVETTAKYPAFKPLSNSGLNRAFSPESSFGPPETSSARATRLSGTPKGPPPVFTGFDNEKLAAPLKLGDDGKPKSAKYTFAKLAQESGEMPHTKQEAELWFKTKIQPGMEEAGFAVDWVKGDKAMIRTRENPQGEVVDFLRGADSNDPNYQALAWQPENAGGAAAAGGAAGADAVTGISDSWKAILDQITQELEAENPDLTAANVSPEQRKANMATLRDKFVEKARAKGLDVGWNHKRGDGPLSIDAVAFRGPQGTGVLDIGFSYDDTSKPLKLQAIPVGGAPGFTLDKRD